MGYEQALELRVNLARRVGVDPIIQEMAGNMRDLYRDNLDDPIRPGISAIECGLADGAPIYWSPEMSNMLELASEQMPPWTLRHESLPASRGFMYFARPLRLPKLEGEFDVSLKAIAFETDPGCDGLRIMHWYESDESMTKGACYPALPSFWQFGQDSVSRLNAYDEVDEELHFYRIYERYFACALALMEQTIVGKRVERAPRSTRKRLGDVGETPIQVIRLRRTVHTSSVDDDREKAYELSCQFVVRMHWRQQFYRSDGSHRPILIAPYVKGPEGAPLKVHADRVFVVDR